MTEVPEAWSGLDDLLDLDQREGIDMRPTLLRVLTDLYLQRPTHTPEDERYYTELALRLIEAADVPQRAALASRLARYDAAPADVVECLARDVIEVAAPVLEHSSCLALDTLAAIARELGGMHAQIIAHRAPGAAAAQPQTATQTAAARSEAHELAELFHAADAHERRLILISLDYCPLAPATPVAALQRADVWRLETSALQHNAETVVRELERALCITRTRARRIVGDQQGEPVVAAAKALELPADSLQRMLLFLNPHFGQSVHRVYRLAELYEEISVAAARRLVALWRKADEGESRPASYEPVAWRAAADQARRALSQVSQVSRRPDLQRDPRPARGAGR